MLTQISQDEEAIQSDAPARQPNGGKVSKTLSVLGQVSGTRTPPRMAPNRCESYPCKHYLPCGIWQNRQLWVQSQWFRGTKEWTPCFKRLWCPCMPYVHQRRLPHRQRVGALPQHNLPTEIKYRQTQYHSSLHWGDSPLTSLRQGTSHGANWKTGNCKVMMRLVFATESVSVGERRMRWGLRRGGKREKGAMFLLRSKISCEEGSTCEERVIKFVDSWRSCSTSSTFCLLEQRDCAFAPSTEDVSSRPYIPQTQI